jgi:hypothetical protein
MPLRLCEAGQNRFGLGKNFSRDEAVWIQVKFFRNNIIAAVKLPEGWMHPLFSSPNIVFQYPVALIYHLFRIN